MKSNSDLQARWNHFRNWSIAFVAAALVGMTLALVHFESQAEPRSGSAAHGGVYERTASGYTPMALDSEWLCSWTTNEASAITAGGEVSMESTSSTSERAQFPVSDGAETQVPGGHPVSPSRLQ